ncbi:MAG: hypothetical protein MOGMAGMI_00896 [Candidatus Omnitrophica bacterium]|nr:hypothetical protein [Candidatus Omnitrophota bacterium]
MGTDRSILAVGSVALDNVRTPFGRVSEALGGSATYFGAAARFFAPVRLVAVVGRDFPERHLGLLRRLGVDTSAVQRASGRTFRWKGYYGYDLNNARTLKTELNVFSAFDPQLPETHRTAGTVFLANIDPDLQLKVLRQVRSPRLVACDTMNFWIENKKPSLLKLLSKVDILLCNDSEVRELSGEYNLIRAARWALSKGPKVVVIKKGEHGVACFTRQMVFCVPAFLLEQVYDPTGAGDTFAGGFIGTLAKGGRVDAASLRRAVIYGSVLASYNVESFSLNRVAGLKYADIQLRFKALRAMTRF